MARRQTGQPLHRRDTREHLGPLPQSLQRLAHRRAAIPTAVHPPRKHAPHRHNPLSQAHLVDRDLHRPRTASGPWPCRLGCPRAARLRRIAAVSYTLVVPEHPYVETWRGASTPRGCEDPPRLHRTPVRQVREGSRSRATVGRSNAPAVPASCPPRPEGSHPGPGEGNGIRTATRSRNNARPSRCTRFAERSDASAVHPHRGYSRASSTGCRSETHATISPDRAPERMQVRASVGGARAERTAHEGKPAFRGWKSARTARQDREMRARFVRSYPDRSASNRVR